MLIIGIAGGTGSGKTTVARKILKSFRPEDVAIITQDSYYRDNSHISIEERRKINFDHPNSIEFELLISHLKELKDGKSIPEPTYSFISSTRGDETKTITPKKVLIVEGILVLYDKELRDLFDIKVFVQAPADDRLIRVIRRDIAERGRNVDMVLERYLKTVQPSHQQFIEPTKAHADIIVPQGGNNEVAIKILKSVIQMKLQDQE